MNDSDLSSSEAEVNCFSNQSFVTNQDWGIMLLSSFDSILATTPQVIDKQVDFN